MSIFSPTVHIFVLEDHTVSLIDYKRTDTHCVFRAFLQVVQFLCVNSDHNLENMHKKFTMGKADGSPNFTFSSLYNKTERHVAGESSSENLIEIFQIHKTKKLFRF